MKCPIIQGIGHIWRNNNLDTARRILLIVIYLVSGSLLLVLFYDLQTGNIVPGVKGGGTLPHQVYVLVLPALIHIMYRTLKG